MTEGEFRAVVRGNAVNAVILDRLGALGVAQAHLTAGALFQTVWNARSGQPPEHGVLDYDVFYWDDDVSFGAEDRVIARAAAVFADVDARIEVRNQARVHVWFPRRTGLSRPPLTSVRDGIDQFLVACTCVGIDAQGAVYAPDGLADLAAGRLRRNARNHTPQLYAAKVEGYRARWPWLTDEERAPLPAGLRAVYTSSVARDAHPADAGET